MTGRTQGIRQTKMLDQLVAGLNEGPFRVAVVESTISTTKDGKPYLEVQIMDRSARAKARCFEGGDRAGDFLAGNAVEIRRLTHHARYGPNFEVADYRVLAAGEFSPGEFVPSLASERVEALWKEFHSFLDSVRSRPLQDLRSLIWGDEALAAKYKWHVSAVKHHHNYRGGNLEHVVGIMRVVEAVAAGYPAIDRDLVVFGAAVHDLGKLVEYEVGTTIRVTDDGRWRGHLVIGTEWIGRLVARLRGEGHDFPKELEDHLVHMVLSHHGKGAWGSPKPPATAEAMLLHLADYADSQTRGFLQVVEENRHAPDGWARYWDPSIQESRNVRVPRDDE